MFRENYPLAWVYHSNTSLVFSKQMRRHEWHGRPFKEYADLPLIPLPPFKRPRLSLVTTIEMRRSCRHYALGAMSLEDVSTLLHYSYGILRRSVTGTSEVLLRPVPSGGGLYPLELYFLSQNVKGLGRGLYHYSAISHGLEKLFTIKNSSFEKECFVDPTGIQRAACIIFITSVVGRMCWKYGDRGYRMLLMEAGHVAQNINLVATSLKLGSLNINGFYDSAVSKLLHLDTEEEVPLYCVAVGKRQGVLA